MLIAGGYWYLRAAIKTGGNPIPITKFGPLHLPTPDQMPLDPRPRFAVAHYLTDPTIYRRWFFPQLDNAFGPLWPLILIAAVAAAIFIVVRSRNRILRVIAAAALATAFVYLSTPLTAAGQDGSPTGFFTNTRYLVPGLVLAMALLPIARPLRAPDKRAWQTLLFLAGVYTITVLTTPRWYTGYIFGTIFITLALVWVPAGLVLGRVRGQFSRGLVAVVAAVVLLFAVVLGRAQQVQYADHHYTKATLSLGEGGPQKSYDFARGLWHQRIGISGSSEIIFGQYGFYGAHLDNHVKYIGVPGPPRSYRLPPPPPAPPHLPGLSPPDQRRRLRLPDHQRIPPGLPERRILVPDLPLGEGRPGAEAGHRRAQDRAPARLRLQGRRQARSGRLRRRVAPRGLRRRRARARGPARRAARAAPTRTCGRRPRGSRGEHRGSAKRSAGRSGSRGRGRRCRG